MSKHPQKPTAAPTTAKLPGDHLSSGEERQARESTLAQIRDEIDSERARNEAADRALAKKLSTGEDPIKLAQTQETPEQRAKSFEATIELVRSEMEAQYAENPPRSHVGGIDEASIELIRAELAKSHKRVVLPSG
jgi:hypothetical protein